MEDIKEKEKLQRFMFDLNIFDEDYIEEVEEEEPPPPTFSEEELEQARKEAFAKGRAEALEESRQSREQYIAQQLEKIASTLPGLFTAEEMREKAYENESVALALMAFRKLFPALNAAQGFEEIKEMLTAVLDSQHQQSEIKIEVEPDAVDGIREHLETISKRLGTGRFEVSGNEALGTGDCKVAWKDGGAVRDATGLAREIEKQLEQMLAAGGTSVHNREVEEESEDEPEADINATEETSGTGEADTGTPEMMEKDDE